MVNRKGRFGIHGGQYIPETLMNAVIELEEAYEQYKKDPEFNRELTALLNDYAGRPSLLYYAKNMTEDLGGCLLYTSRNLQPERRPGSLCWPFHDIAPVSYTHLSQV